LEEEENIVSTCRDVGIICPLASTMKSTAEMSWIFSIYLGLGLFIRKRICGEPNK